MSATASSNNTATFGRPPLSPVSTASSGDQHSGSGRSLCLEEEDKLLADIIQEHNTMAGLERLRARLGQQLMTALDESTLADMLRKKNFDADAVARDVFATVLDKR